jgi:hypothetical protein
MVDWARAAVKRIVMERDDLRLLGRQGRHRVSQRHHLGPLHHAGRSDLGNLLQRHLGLPAADLLKKLPAGDPVEPDGERRPIRGRR